MYIHDVIKMMYANIGFLPNTPYHLVSDAEMCEAFIREEGFFDTYYYCPCEDLQEPYDTLVEYMKGKIDAFVQNGEPLPDWIYSYMIMRPITYESPEADIAYICDMSNIDFPGALAEFTPDVARTCYKVSKKWLQKIPQKDRKRPPTMFGETHVTKSLRIRQANVLLDVDIGVNS